MADGSVSTTVGISTNSSNIQATWSVTANGSSAYRFTGPGNDAADDNPDLYLVRGQRYRFINTTGSGHPFRIQYTGTTTGYGTTWVTGDTAGTQMFVVPHDAPSTLEYQCTIHPGMKGTFIIPS